MFNFFKKKSTIKPTVLVILDGFGIAPPSNGNAINLAHKPNFDMLVSTYPHGQLIASGESVGLPANEVGNTEVGHLTIGAGRTILQDLKRINLAVENGSIYDNQALINAANSAKSNGKAFHIMGLASTGNVHSSMSHLLAMIQFCKKENLSEVYLHLFTDGRDAPPKEGIEVIEKIETQLAITKLGKIASITGRYYAMDRDSRWDRTLKTYNALVSGLGIQTLFAKDAVNGAYLRGQTDEFIEPTLIADKNGPIGLIKDGDSVVFFNYRIDRPKQLTLAFVEPNLESLAIEDMQNVKRSKVLTGLNFVTMTEYQKGLPVTGVAFGPTEVPKSLNLILSESGLKQVHLAESEKQRFVTYYFDGIRETGAPGEDWAIVSSPKVATYDKKPEMSLGNLVSEFKKQMGKDIYNFAVINFANADMVAHSGNLEATIKAINYVDKYLYDLVDYVLQRDGTVLITADHGNAEELVTFPASTYFFTTEKGTINTDHSNNPVPIVVINNKFKGHPVDLGRGSLGDVAPTILAILGIPKPEIMTGRNLLASRQTTNN